MPKHVGDVGDLTFEVGFVITAAVYLSWTPSPRRTGEHAHRVTPAHLRPSPVARVRFADCVPFYTAV